MRGRTKLISLAAMLSILLTVSMVFASGVVDVSKLALFGSEPLSPGPDVSMDPRKMIDKTKVAGSLVTFDVNVTGVTDLYTWQINLTWSLDTVVAGRAMLSVNRILSRDFLGATKETSSEVLGLVINVTDNTKRTAVMAESVLGDVAGVSGSGDLVRIEFLVLNYGTADITILVSGTLPTSLLNGAGTSLTFAKFDGVFRNTKPGDADHDGDVDGADFLTLRAAYLKAPGAGYNRESDTDLDGDVDGADFLTLRANYLK